MNRITFERFAAAALIQLLGICWGCGTGEYERRLEGRIAEIKTESKFNFLSQPRDVPDTQVSIRIPQEFKSPPLVEGGEIEGKPIDPRRVKPNVINIPGLKLTFEGFIEDANKGKQPYYLYIGVTTDERRANYPRIMVSELKSKSNTTTELSDLQAPTPQGRSLDWRKCRATGNQEFFYVPLEGEPSFRRMPGIIDLLFYDQGDILVIMAWRMPSGLEQSFDFPNWEAMTAGCMRV